LVNLFDIQNKNKSIFFLIEGDWQPSHDDLRCLSIQAYKLRDRDLRFERLDITQSVAEEMFAYDRFKLSQIRHVSFNVPI